MKGKRVLTRLLLAGLLLPPPALPEPMEIVVWKRNFHSPSVLALIQLALDRTPEYGPAELRPSLDMSQGRAITHLERGNREAVRVANVASSPVRESRMQPIAIPFDRGLLGYRVCLIREGEQARFDGIRSPKDFQQRDLSIGQGAHWPDTTILRASGFDVVTSPRFENLFRMLQRERFDCFARGVGEVLIDMEQHDTEGLTLEQGLLLVYPMPSYLFVGNDDTLLAQRLELGIRRAMKDSSFDDFYDRYFRSALVELDLEQRTVLALPNPYASEHGIPFALPIIPVRPESFRSFPADAR